MARIEKKKLKRSTSPKRYKRGLGLMSLGLGLAELAMPRRITRATGLRGQEGLLRAYGIRELGQGLGLMLSPSHPTTVRRWIWARVAGDALDLATASRGLRARNRYKGRTVATLVGLAGVTLTDALAARKMRQQQALE